MSEQLKITLLVALGGSLGTLLRHGFNLATLFTPYPLGTLLENIVGSLLLSLLAGWAASRALSTLWAQYGFGVGFCGGFTTMSTLAADAVVLSAALSPWQAAIYLALSLIGGLAAAWVGYEIGRHVAARAEAEP